MAKKILLFDFDETLVNITDLHRQAWKFTLQDVGLTDNLNSLLPNVPFRMERFDSVQRINRYFFEQNTTRLILENHFRTSDRSYITSQLLDLKESHILYLINKLNYSEAIQRLALNFLTICDILIKKYDFGIVSSTRQSVIYSYLQKVDLIDVFKFVIGEEALWYNDRLFDKPSAYALKDLFDNTTKNTPCAYIGDDVRIDSLFAKNIGTTYIQASAKDDFMSLLSIIEATA